MSFKVLFKEKLHFNENIVEEEGPCNDQYFFENRPYCFPDFVVLAFEEFC